MAIIAADYSFAEPSVAALRAAGIGAVGRYFGQGGAPKNLTAAEAKLLSDAGIEIFAIFEFGARQAMGGAAQARADVACFRAQRAQVGMPDDRPCYFAVDFDIPDYAPSSQDPRAKLGPVGDYFAQIRQEIGRNAGAYGGYWLVKRLFDAGLISWGFQTAAWSGGQWDARACLRQTGATALGNAVDLDTPERADFGQWRVGPVPAPAPKPAGPTKAEATAALAVLAAYVARG
jgi:Rv2525c-like, glycoside hydrolase-like domain